MAQARSTDAPDLGNQKILVLLVNFQNYRAQPFTVEAAQNAFFSTTSKNKSITNFYTQESHRRLHLTGTVKDWITLPMDAPQGYDACGITRPQVSKTADAAIGETGLNIKAYTRIVYLTPPLSCGYAGWADLYDQHVYLNGKLSAPTLAHELGHSYGLDHANAWRCWAKPRGSKEVIALGDNCQIQEYFDPFSIMGVTAYGNNAWAREFLGFTRPGDIKVVNRLGVYRLRRGQALVVHSNKQIKDLYGNTSSYDYYFDYRQENSVFTRWSADLQTIKRGITIYLGPHLIPGQRPIATSTLLLDATPHTSSFKDAVFLPGLSFVASDTGLRLHVLRPKKKNIRILVSKIN